LLILQKKSFAFAPAMSLAALGSFTIGVLWEEHLPRLCHSF
jgi:hypothetical protein